MAFAGPGTGCRHYVASAWAPKKLNVELQMPHALDLDSLADP